MSKRKKSSLGTFFVIGLFAYFIYTMITQQSILFARQTEVNNIQAKIAQEDALNKDLKKQKEDMYTDENIEKIAREKLGMVKQGEKVFVDVNK